MAERRRLSDEQLKTLDALIAEVARRNITDQGRVPVEDWWDEVNAAAHELATAITGYADEATDVLTQVDISIAAPGGPVEILDQLPASDVEKFREAGPMPSLEDLILIRSKYR
jgi:hypothetical protein